MSETNGKPLIAESIEVISAFCRREVTEETRLVADLDLDSIDVAELVANIEDHFDVVIPMESLPEIRTVGDIARSLAPLVNRQDVSTGSAS